MVGVGMWMLLVGTLAFAQCDTAVLTSQQLPRTFFTCFNHDKATAGLCTSPSSVCVANCLQETSVCVDLNCSTMCIPGNSPSNECAACVNANCVNELEVCSGVTVSFTCGFFCQQEYWVFPVVIAAVALGGVILLLGLYCLIRLCCCGHTKSKSSAMVDNSVPSYSNSNSNNNLAETYGLYQKRNILSLRQSAKPPSKQGDEEEGDFEATNPVYSHERQSTVGGGKVPERVSLTMKKVATSLRSSLTNKQRTVDSNVRVSKLPEGFRQSIQVGLTPDMIFDLATASTMKQANQSSPLPQRVIQSHKFAQMMGVEENALHKPYSEPVTDRVERMAKAANKQGINVGGSTAGLGPQVAQQFTVRQQARAEEERIREEIRQLNLLEKKQAKAKHASTPISPPEQPSQQPPVNKLKQFLDQQQH
ncbi:hypothetical protein BASA81_000404 [Batrachochytrium salamandrivorans]|nr:hypothetical protein BASA81_000404 [Batrachochytrium salamandrivorans]